MESPVGGSRSTSVVVVVVDTCEVYIVVSLSTRTDTQVIYVDPSTGALRYRGKFGFDVFRSENEALDYLSNGSPSHCKSKTHARAILGYTALGGYGFLLVATNLADSIPDLPGGGCVFTVIESQWIKIPLHNPQPQGRGEIKNVQELAEVDIDRMHFFCETRDITRPFPSRMPVLSPDNEFVWNGWLSLPFINIGLMQHCVILLQGFVESRSFGSLGQVEGIVALTARRSRLHPGTRYLARGINSCFSAGNEVECEQIVWVPKKPGESVPFNTYIWRRGSIPMWWGAELKMTAAEAEIYVSDWHPYKGSLQYYQRLFKRYDARNLDVGIGENQNEKPFVPIVCVNLLRNGEGKSERILVHHFEESLNHIKSTGKLPYTRIHLVNYDWHARIRLQGEQQTIEELWKLLKAPTMAISISEGDYLAPQMQLKECRGEIIHNDDFEGAFCLRSHQNGVLRFNCADSLDRTNAASYFGAVQVFVEQCQRLQLSLDNDLAHEHQSVDNNDSDTAPLPPGWEKQSDASTGKNYYIDHNTETTISNHPCPDKPWKKFDMTFELEMFLGIRLFKHLPSVPIQPLHVFSRPSGFFLKTVRSMFETSSGGDSLLSFKKKDQIWVCPEATDVVELFIYLGEPCHVCQLLLTVSHGADDSTYPSTVDVRTGRNLDGLKLVVEGAIIPRCGNGTNLLIPLSGLISADDMTVTEAGAHLPDQVRSLSLLYDFEELEGDLDFLTRIVAVTFYPAASGTPMTLGEVEILGVSLPWNGVFANEGRGARLIELATKYQKETNPYFSGSDTNLFTSISLSHDAVPASAKQGSADKGVTENADSKGGDHKSSTSQDSRPQENGSQKYLNRLISLAGPQMERSLNFLEAMELDIEPNVNPNFLIDGSYMGRLSKVASTLALLGQTALEDKMNGAIGLEKIEDNVIDFWNISSIGESCSGGMCEVCVNTKETLSASSMGSCKDGSDSVFKCSECHKKACRVCCAGRGALLLQNYPLDGTNYNALSSQGTQVDRTTNRSVTLDSVVCKKCCHEIILDALVLDYVRVLISLRRRARADSAAYKALDEVMGFSFLDVPSDRSHLDGNHQAFNSLKQLLSGEESLAEFPFASFLHPVETATDSAPFLSLLTPLDYGLWNSYWKAPPNTTSVDFVIVLGTLSDVKGVVLLVSPCGYSEADTPMVQIMASKKLDREEKSCLGKWDVQALISSSPEFYGPEKSGGDDKLPRHIKFTFTNPVRCRIVQITLSLRLERPGSSSPQETQCASFGGAMQCDPRLHAKHIVIAGSPVREEMGNGSSESTDQINYINRLNQAPQLSRFKVPIESERLMDHDLVLEQYLPPSSPFLAGFLLEAFNTIKPRITHSPSSDADIWDTSITFLEDRHISPAVLYIKVSAIQDGKGSNMVTIAEYRLPETKPGTPMYFDFPEQIQTRRICFRLVGDVSAFADDPMEQDVSGFRAPPAGLSLSNKIKLYHCPYSHDGTGSVPWWRWWWASTAL
ncbi:putative phosphoinositide phosphatase SAC9 [Hibiscus syriacus]|uniref:Phosphoinositide phosphatase SAC9 n=1 Tax=Hibiscus syriacus TaxID=106335 RepID=A0A6A3BD05_HIBSY|nr:putative phosphoinositide phosphatase SAC9 [Hibiscus syriacus]